MFAVPSALWLLALCAVPVAIHLLSTTRPRRIVVSSLRFVAASQAQSVRSLRLTDIPLMLLRVLVVAAFVLAAAGPHLWLPPADPGSYVLVFEDVRDEPRAHRVIDSLLADGYEVREVGYRRGVPELSDAIAAQDSTIPAGSRVVVVAGGGIGHLAGSLTGLGSSYSVMPVESERGWIEEAVSSDGALVADSVHSRADVTFRERVAMAAGATTEFRAPIRVRIPVVEGRTAVTTALRSAFAAISEVAGWQMVFSDSAPDIAVDLSGADTHPEAGLRISEAADDGEVVSDEFDPTGTGLYSVALTKYSLPAGVPLIRSEKGRVIIAVERGADDDLIINLGTRFDPEWSELGRHPTLPTLLYSLARRSPSAVVESHMIDVRDARKPALLFSSRAESATSNRAASIQIPVLLFALVLFGLERMLARRRDA